MVMVSSGKASHEKESNINTHSFTLAFHQGPSPLRGRTPSKVIPGSGECHKNHQHMIQFASVQIEKEQALTIRNRRNLLL